MNRKTVIAGAIFAGLILLTIGLLRTPEKGSRPAGEQRPRPIAKLKAGDYDTLEVIKGTSDTVIKKEGDKYSLVKPVPFPADKDSAKAAFEVVEKLEFGNLISDQKSRYSELEVGDGGLRVKVRKGETVLADLHVGKFTNDQLLVRLEGKDEIWATKGVSKYQWDKDTTAWRDKHVTTFEEKDATKIEVVSKTRGRMVMSRPEPSDAGPAPEWRIVESSVKVEPFDKSAATELVNGFTGLTADEFVDNAKPEETGLEAPENTVTITLRNGKEYKALFGLKKKDKDDTYLKLADNPQVFVVSKYTAGRINKRPIDFRDKTMCNLTAGEITEVSVTREKDSFVLSKTPGKTGDDAWKLVKPAGITLDTSKVNNILSAFSDWKANSYADDNALKPVGLDKPKITISAKSNVKGHSCLVKSGNEAKDNTYLYAVANGQPDVVTTTKWTVERIAVKLDDLKKK
jgi:hypothetical protein